ncbi:MAG TPA: Rnase Y domain-containing protein, partial [Mycobacteriales bacterium]
MSASLVVLLVVGLVLVVAVLAAVVASVVVRHAGVRANPPAPGAGAAIRAGGEPLAPTRLHPERGASAGLDAEQSVVVPFRPSTGGTAMAVEQARAEAAAARAAAERILDDARQAAGILTERARAQAEAEATTAREAHRRASEREAEEIAESARRLAAEVDRREARLAEREERLDAEQHRMEQRDRELARAEADLARREDAIADLELAHHAELERIGGLTADAAKAELVRAIETQAKREAAVRVRDLEAEARATGESRARRIVVDAIQRVASEQTAESVVSVLHLPTDEMKGRIIGREGRNIRTFESVTGVNLIIDDTPEAVLLSCFDPVRREIGRLTLEKLVLDGRIHPHRIEEVYEHSKTQVEQLCVRAGEDALVEVGITDVHPELVVLLGRLRYRTSYGQNVLKHLVETA